MIRVDDVACELTGLRSISLSIAPGQVLAIAGPNGAGKTTLLSLLSGERSPDAGRVTLDEKEVAHLAPAERARRIGVLPQSSSLSFAFRVDEVVALGRVGQPAARELVTEAMVQADVLHLAARLYPTLSGGEKQRVHLARVLAQTLDAARCLLLLDEPTASLDPAQAIAVLQVARARAAAGHAVAVVLHDLNLVARWADRVALLHAGRLHALGAPWEVLTPENLAACYGLEAVILPHPRDGSPLVVAA